jgi:hypothetical protein
MVPGFENQNPLIEDKDMQAREIILTFGLGMSPRGPKIRATCTLKHSNMDNHWGLHDEQSQQFTKELSGHFCVQPM